MSFSALPETDFFGRGEELAGLSRRVLRADKDVAQSAVLSGPLGIGKTELLKQLFGYLFWRQDRVVPFYYTVNSALLSAAAFSKDYLTRYLCQRLAFEKKEQSLFYLEGLSIDGLSALVEEREAVWAREILDRFIRSSGDPLDAMRVAVSAPYQSALATGMPAAVLIDEFHRLKDLHIGDTRDPRLVSLFEAPMSFRKTPHIITGSAAEIHEMPVSRGLERVSVPPLGPEDAASRALSLFRASEAGGTAPLHVLSRLGGNPFYIACVLRRACEKKDPSEIDFRKAYAREVLEGPLALSWSSVLKSHFPGPGLRRIALTLAHKIHHTNEPLSCQRIAKSLSLTDDQAEATAHALHLAGFVRGEFGVFRAVEDGVLRDVIDFLYRRELLGKSSHDLEEELLNNLLPEKEGVVRFDMILPMVKEAELVAAQCLDQIGKNLNLNQDAVGQLQIAVIEACINAIEHGKGTEKKIYVSVASDGDRLEVSIESAGREFVVQESGEPFGDREGIKAPGRGWGIKLMKRFVDEVRFEKTARGMKTVLVKNLAKTAGVQKEDRTGRE
jgi:anti-sigma regulatory factor (Ser/Thr protein kinase)